MTIYQLATPATHFDNFSLTVGQATGLPTSLDEATGKLVVSTGTPVTLFNAINTVIQTGRYVLVDHDSQGKLFIIGIAS